MRNKKANQRMTLLTLVVALGVAVYLNWEYAKSTDIALSETAPVATTVGVSADDVVLDALAVDGEVGDKNYGEAQLVSVGEAKGDKFFEEARLSRTKTRDEALDKLQKSLKSAKLTTDEKTAATEALTNTLNNITLENEIETLIKAKGFVDCVAFIDNDKVNVTVMTTNDGLTKEEVAQIRDIVLSKCSVTAQNITIVEVK